MGIQFHGSFEVVERVIQQLAPQLSITFLFVRLFEIKTTEVDQRLLILGADLTAAFVFLFGIRESLLRLIQHAKAIVSVVKVRSYMYGVLEQFNGAFQLPFLLLLQRLLVI